MGGACASRRHHSLITIARLQKPMGFPSLEGKKRWRFSDRMKIGGTRLTAVQKEGREPVPQTSCAVKERQLARPCTGGGKNILPVGERRGKVPDWEMGVPQPELMEQTWCAGRTEQKEIKKSLHYPAGFKILGGGKGNLSKGNSPGGNYIGSREYSYAEGKRGRRSHRTMGEVCTTSTVEGSASASFI